MHLSEGVLHSQTLIVGAAVAVMGIALGLKRLQSDRLSLTALFAATFFVASTIHIPVGIGSVHLILNGVAGIFLGWAVFPAFLIALVLQALLFSFGGFSVLGVNLCIMALPALVVHYLSRPLLRELTRKRLISAGILAGANITWGQFFFNMIPVFLGNVVGGASFVGASYLYTYKDTLKDSAE